MSLVNLSFATADAAAAQSGLYLLPPSLKRLNSPAQLLGELGPHGFLLAVSTTRAPGTTTRTDAGVDEGADDDEIMLATASAKPLHSSYDIDMPDVPELVKRFKRGAPTATPPSSSSSSSPDAVSVSVSFEIFAMAVHPSLQRAGLASHMLAVLEAHIVRRGAASLLSSSSSPAVVVGSRSSEVGSGSLSDDGETEKSSSSSSSSNEMKKEKKGKKMPAVVEMVLSTMKVLNAAWYVKRGYVLTREVSVEKGVFGSEGGFVMAEMGKRVGVEV